MSKSLNEDFQADVKKLKKKMIDWLPVNSGLPLVTVSTKQWFKKPVKVVARAKSSYTRRFGPKVDKYLESVKYRREGTYISVYIEEKQLKQAVQILDSSMLILREIHFVPGALRETKDHRVDTNNTFIHSPISVKYRKRMPSEKYRVYFNRTMCYDITDKQFDRRSEQFLTSLAKDIHQYDSSVRTAHFIERCMGYGGAMYSSFSDHVYIDCNELDWCGVINMRYPSLIDRVEEFRSVEEAA